MAKLARAPAPNAPEQTTQGCGERERVSEGTLITIQCDLPYITLSRWGVGGEEVGSRTVTGFASRSTGSTRSMRSRRCRQTMTTHSATPRMLCPGSLYAHTVTSVQLLCLAPSRVRALRLGIVHRTLDPRAESHPGANPRVPSCALVRHLSRRSRQVGFRKWLRRWRWKLPAVHQCIQRTSSSSKWTE